jgi:hypothetical protein
MNRPTRIGLAFTFAVPTLLGARVAFAESGTYESVYGLQSLAKIRAMVRG